LNLRPSPMRVPDAPVTSSTAGEQLDTVPLSQIGLSTPASACECSVPALEPRPDVDARPTTCGFAAPSVGMACASPLNLGAAEACAATHAQDASWQGTAPAAETNPARDSMPPRDDIVERMSRMMEQMERRAALAEAEAQTRHREAQAAEARALAAEQEAREERQAAAHARAQLEETRDPTVRRLHYDAQAPLRDPYDLLFSLLEQETSVQPGTTHHTQGSDSTSWSQQAGVAVKAAGDVQEEVATDGDATEEEQFSVLLHSPRCTPSQLTHGESPNGVSWKSVPSGER
jgi:hypothetical protein